MQKLTRNRIVLLAAMVIVLATAVFCLMRRNNPGVGFLRALSNSTQNQADSSETAAGVNVSSNLSGSPRGPQSSDAAVLLEEWLSSPAKSDGTGTAEIFGAIIQSLRNYPNGNAAFYQRVKQLLEDRALDLGRKQELISMLDRAATPAAFELLAALAQHNLPADLKRAVLNAISNAGEYYWDKQASLQIAPMLQQMWLQSNDVDLLRSVAAALAKIGDAASVNTLMQVAMRNSSSVTDIEGSSDPRASAAWMALQRLRDPEVVPVILEQLRSSTNTLEMSLSADLLASMGTVEGTQALLSWAQGAGDNYVPIVREAVARIGTYDCIQYLKSALAQNPGFNSGLIKAAFLSKVKA